MWYVECVNFEYTKVHNDHLIPLIVWFYTVQRTIPLLHVKIIGDHRFGGLSKIVPHISYLI